MSRLAPLGVALALVLAQCASRSDRPRTPELAPETRNGAQGEPRDLLSPSPHLALGVPTDADPSDDVVLDERDFVLSYNPRRRGPNWVAWRLDRANLGRTKRRDDFRPDPSLPTDVYRVVPGDYAHSGYDRGHLCPSGDRTATRAMTSMTFLMTNVSPQLHELNAGPWEKLEERERALAGERDAEVYVVAGPVYGGSPASIGHGVAVPDGFWKIIVPLRREQTAADVTERTPVLSVLMPNEPGVGAREWTELAVSVDQIEQRTGYDFLSAIPDAVETRLEARR